MPVRPAANGLWGWPPGWSPTAGDTVALGAMFNIIYSRSVIYALANPDGLPGIAVRRWVEFGRYLPGPAYSLAGSAGRSGAPARPFVARAWAFDIHLTVINLIVVTTLIVASRRYCRALAGARA